MDFPPVPATPLPLKYRFTDLKKKDQIQIITYNLKVQAIVNALFNIIHKIEKNKKDELSAKKNIIILIHMELTTNTDNPYKNSYLKLIRDCSSLMGSISDIYFVARQHNIEKLYKIINVIMKYFRDDSVKNVTDNKIRYYIHLIKLKNEVAEYIFPKLKSLIIAMRLEDPQLKLKLF